MDNQPIQVHTGSPNFNTHKVFAAIGIILTVVIILIAGLWYFTSGQGTEDEDQNVKVSTSSAKPATNSATKSATISAN